MANNIAAGIGIALLLGLAAAPLQGQHMHGESESGLMGGPLGVPRTRMGSGSAWLPDATPMRAYHWMPGRWMPMLHGDGDLIFDHQFTERGASKIGSTNWLMFMGDAAGREVHRPAVSVNVVPNALRSVYGTRLTVGLVGYLRLRPALAR